MGQLYQPNLALDTNLIVRLLEHVLQDILIAESNQEKYNLVICGFYVTFTYVTSLRGSEGFMLNLTIMRERRNLSEHYLIVSLKGKVKGKSNERDHVFPYCKTTDSGIKMHLWLDLMITAHKGIGRLGGPPVTSWDGDILDTETVDEFLHQYLLKLYCLGFEFPREVSNVEDSQCSELGGRKIIRSDALNNLLWNNR